MVRAMKKKTREVERMNQINTSKEGGKLVSTMEHQREIRQDVKPKRNDRVEFKSLLGHRGKMCADLKGVAWQAHSSATIKALQTHVRG